MDAGRREWISHSGAEQGRSDSRHEDPAGRRRGTKIPLAVQPVEPHGKRCTQLFVDSRHRRRHTEARLSHRGAAQGRYCELLRKRCALCVSRRRECPQGLRETLQSLGVTEVMEAMDMDQFTNPQVRQAIGTLRRKVQSIPGIRYYQCTWNPRFKGVDDYLLDWTKRRTA